MPSRRIARRCRLTSPNRRWILKLRLLILRVGEPGKQLRQFPREYTRSRSICAMVGGCERWANPNLGFDGGAVASSQVSWKGRNWLVVVDQCQEEDAARIGVVEYN